MLTATAAGTLLGALWFVPSANATVTAQAEVETSATPASQVTQQARVTSTDVTTTADHTQLADTGSPNTTPYIVGGTAFLGLGAGFVAYSMRRERLGF
ncbi:LAETG motif-containing sortase-dependent surface protein [Streptomyces graminifolii]|uniref:LAETG motif-containing sortase-dependent surface protein n=1 Tax=Streptomyces TaxID=1883 RepID=UPI003698D72C